MSKRISRRQNRRHMDFPGTRNDDDEEEPVIVAEGSWLRLSPDSEAVPDHLKGHWAAIVDAPRYPCTDPDCVDFGNYHEHQPEDTPITVRTRDAYNQLLTLTREDFDEYSSGVPATRV